MDGVVSVKNIIVSATCLETLATLVTLSILQIHLTLQALQFQDYIYVEILVFHSYISAFSIEIYVTDTSPRGRTGDLINGFRIITQ